ncbi:uncharacterized protein [Temnothorax nylanderi]|uniref:uncharacterized protein n=1 Tax=Temnothorax nylanderi TaxID=102681 RepID=UPI003A836A9B
MLKANRRVCGKSMTEHRRPWPVFIPRGTRRLASSKNRKKNSSAHRPPSARRNFSKTSCRIYWTRHRARLTSYRRSSISQTEVRRMQMEREKQIYDFDNLQSQLNKALGQSARMQKEREAIQLDVDRLQDKYEKAQVIMQRLQKERDSFQEEMEKMHERIEFQQNQIAKMQREKENVLSELDLVKERWEKMHNTHQKLTNR